MAEYAYKPTRGLSMWLRALIGMAIGAMLLNLLDDGYVTYLLHGVMAQDAARAAILSAHGASLARLQTTVNVVLVLAFLVNIVLFCVWLYRSAANIRALGASGLEYSPGWTVGYFFIPIANLVMPYRTVREVWLASHDPRDWSAHGSTPLVLGWWGTYLAAGVGGRLSSVMMQDVGHDLSAILHSVYVEMASMALGMAAAVMCLLVIIRITRAQRDHAVLADRPTTTDLQPG